MRRFGELQARGRALVIGAGTGTNAIWLAEQSLEVTALDIAETAIEQARAKAVSARRVDICFLTHDWLTPEQFWCVLRARGAQYNLRTLTLSPKDLEAA